jgi:hypothetical protein
MLAPSVQPPPLTFDNPNVQLLPGEKRFHWNKNSNIAAQLIAEGNLYFKDIAAKLDIPAHRITKWKQHTEFKARVQSLRDQYADYVYHKGIARLEVRVETYLSDWDNLEAIRKGRANQAAENGLPIPSQVTVEGETIQLQNPPGCVVQEGGAVPGSGMFNPAGGMETGFIVKDYKGKDADQAVYSFDKALFDARLKLREQLSRELGQWADKSLVKTDQPVNQVNITNVSIAATLSEHLAASRRAARASTVIDISPIKVIENNGTQIYTGTDN